MRLHRFYIREKINSQKEIVIRSEELNNQIFRVFRLKTGDKVILFDGSGLDYECSISGLEKNDRRSVTFKVEGNVPSRFVPVREITLCAAIVKKDTFEWIVEKATELGVTKIIPIVAERSEKKNLNEERLEKIAIEASEQSGRGTVPIIHPIITLEEAVGWIGEQNRKNEAEPKSILKAIAFHLEGESFSKSKAEIGIDTNNPLEIFIGPEGGWSPKEIEMFHSHNIPVVSLGNQVLRAETAVVAALSVVML